MKKSSVLLLISLSVTSAFAGTRPSSYTELLDYVQEAPDQGETATCLFMGNTGAMELLANKKAKNKNPKPYGTYDLSESYLINAPWVEAGTTNYDEPVHRFNAGFGIPHKAWKYDAWIDTFESKAVWFDHPNRADLPHVKLPAIESVFLFEYGKKHSQYVLGKEDIEKVKQALWDHKGPVLVNYVDDNFWHVITIVGYDDAVPGECYEISEEECAEEKGSFYIRDSFGVRVQLRDTDSFRIRGNAASVIKLKE